MVNRPSYFSNRPINSLGLIHRERYLPTAFDESLSYVEKLNLMIRYLNEVDQLTNEMLEKWNEVYSWVLEEGLDNAVGDRLQEWIENGTLENIINDKLLGDINEKVDEGLKKINNLIDEIKNVFLISLKEFEDIYYNIGDTTIEWSD